MKLFPAAWFAALFALTTCDGHPPIEEFFRDHENRHHCESIKGWNSMWNFFDLNGDSSVEWIEIASVWEHENLGHHTDVSELFYRMDTDMVGQLSMNDYYKSFHLLDTNSDGCIDRDEFHHLITGLHHHS